MYSSRYSSRYNSGGYIGGYSGGYSGGYICGSSGRLGVAYSRTYIDLYNHIFSKIKLKMNNKCYILRVQRGFGLTMLIIALAKMLRILN